MDPLQELAARLVSQQSQNEIAAENPYFQLQTTPEVLTQYMQEAAIKTPGRYKNRDLALYGLGSGLLSGILSSIGENYQNKLTDRFQRETGEAMLGVNSPDTGYLPPNLFRSARNAGGIFTLQEQYKAAQDRAAAQSNLNQALALEDARSQSALKQKLLEELVKNPRKAAAIMPLLQQLGGANNAAGAIPGSEGNVLPQEERLSEPDVQQGPVLNEFGIEPLVEKQKRLTRELMQDPEVSANQAAIGARGLIEDEKKSNAAGFKKLEDIRAKAAQQIDLADTVDQVLGEGLKPGRGARFGQALAESSIDLGLGDLLGFDNQRAALGQMLESKKGVVMGMNRVVGSGSQSDMEAKAYLMGGPGLDKDTATNQEMARRLRQIGERNRDYADFVQMVQDSGGSVSQADKLWSKYERANPLWIKKGGRLVPNAKITPYSQFDFSGAGKTASESNLGAAVEQEAAAGSAAPSGSAVVGNAEGGGILDALSSGLKSADVYTKSALNTGLFGIPQRAAAGARALAGEAADLFGVGDNRDFGQRITDEMAAVKGQMEQEAKDSPIAAGAGTLTGAIFSPVNKLFAPIKAAQNAPKILKAISGAYNAKGATGIATRAATAAGMVGASKVGTGEELKSSDLTGAALFSAVADAAMKGAGKLAGPASDTFKRMIGISAVDYRRVAKSLKAPDVLEAKQRFTDGLKIIEREHGISPVSLMQGDEAVMSGFVQKAQDSIEPRLRLVEQIVAKGDKATKKPITIIGSSLSAAIKRGGADEKVNNSIENAGMPILNRIRADLKSPENKNAQLSYLLGELRALNRNYKPGVLGWDDAKTALADDIRMAIQSRVDDMAQLGLIPGKLQGQIKKAGLEVRNLIGLQESWANKLPGAMGQDLLGNMNRSLYTSGAAGVGGASSLGQAVGEASGVGGPKAQLMAIATALASYSSRIGRPISYLLSTGKQEAFLRSPEFRQAMLQAQQANNKDNFSFEDSWDLPSDSESKKKVDETANNQPLYNPTASAGRAMLGKAAMFQPVGYAPKDIAKSPYAADLTGDFTVTDMNVHPEVERVFPALIHQESRGKPGAVSPKGATGLAQIMPDTAKEIAKELGIEDYDLKDPATSELFGKHYLSKMFDMFGQDIKLALAAYNAGPGAVRAWIKRFGTKNWDIISKRLKMKNVYKETTDYVPQILARLDSKDNVQV